MAEKCQERKLVSIFSLCNSDTHRKVFNTANKFVKRQYPWFYYGSNDTFHLHIKFN